MCTHFGCLYFNLPFAPRVPSLDSLSFGEMPIASDCWSLSQNVPRPSLQDHQPRHTYISPSNPTESMEAVSTFSNHKPFQGTSSLQVPSAHCGDSSNVNFIGNQMNINFFSGRLAPHGTDEYPLQQRNDAFSQGRYLDTTEAMNASTPQLFPNPSLLPDGSDAQDMNMFTPQAASYALPGLNDFEWQNTPMREEEFSMLLFPQNASTTDESIFLAAGFEGQHQSSRILQWDVTMDMPVDFT
jgi:hypothetical protein